ncbi:unnamed protein product [Phyllotreta striolata]|uniref:Uncharacterized protein n=1 Tax=Phyllotreta striolata TaxID=444603 RepID=A0A9N9TEF5_PHYSR|nr:unnamed protein product [Phyllotreta striolata]
MTTTMNRICFQFIRKYSQSTNKLIIYEQLTGERKGISLIGFNRPKQRNALSKELVENLNNIVDQVACDDSNRVVVLHSLVAKTFCSGADLKERLGMDQQEVHHFVKKLRGLSHKIYSLPVPVIAAIDGVALGGGLELALSSDIRVAADNVKLGLVETKLAIIPGAGGTQFLPRIINPSVAKELIYTASIFGGKEAEKMGLINHLVEQNGDGNAAYLKSLEIAQRILPNGPVAVKMAKQAINRGMQVDIGEGLALEEVCYSKVIPTNDRLEGLQAFSEKRTPIYTGS